MEKTDIKVSFTILTHNESDELKRLLEQIRSVKTTWDEIIIVDDYSDNPKTLEILEWARTDEQLMVKVFQNRLNGDFSAQKNYANSQCKNDYIFNIDADEVLAPKLAESFREIIFINQSVEYFRIPRINTVENITIEHINKWQWSISSLPSETAEASLLPDSNFFRLLQMHNLILHNDNGLVKYYIPIINFPDSQGRIYKNKKEIAWVNKVYEVVTGYKKYSNFPSDAKFSIIHHKTIEKQEQQNSLYQTIK